MKRRSNPTTATAEAGTAADDRGNYRRVIYVSGVQPQANLRDAYKWDRRLEEIRQLGEQQTTADDKVVPVALFGNPPLGHFLKVMHTGLKLEVRHTDYDVLFPDKKIYWIANVNLIVGYRLLMRYEGMDEEGDQQHDFWVSIGSDELKHVGYCASMEHCELLPPNAIRKRQTDWSKYIVCKLHACKTLTPTWERERQLSLVEGRFKVGSRLELLDRQYSNRIRPARVTQQLGRRICVRVCVEDVEEEDLGNDDGQVMTGIWCDESWELVFPVGWALQNDYGLAANGKYRAHCRAIVDALAAGRKAEYAPFDASPEIFRDWTDVSRGGGTDEQQQIQWEVGMKLECLDPLNESFLELKVATCIALLKDGYLKVGFDGPDMEDEAIPIHCTSRYLFPVNYSIRHGIKLVGPPETMEHFSWRDYLRQSQAVAAPEVLFDADSPSRMSQFKVGAKLEATDQCESHLVCPATIRAIRGRLLQIHFDGWDDDYDQLFDHRSRDLFPLGWCEMYGYRLEPPKESEPIAQKKGKKK